MNIIQVEICNWEKFNPRKDVKTNHWFRLNHDFLEDPDFFSFSAEEKLVWIYLLSLASKKGKAVVLVNLAHAERVCGLKPEVVRSALEKLNEINCANVDVTWTLRGRDADVTLRTYVRDVRDERNERTDERNLQGTSKKSVPRERHKKLDKIPSDSTRIRTTFIEAWEHEFQKPYPGWGAKENGQTARWLGSLSLEKALEYCKFYPKWNDPWVTRQGHPFGILVAQYVQLDAWLGRPDVLLRKMADGRAEEKVALKTLESEREMEMLVNLDAKRNQHIGLALQNAVPLTAKRRLPGGGSELPFDETPFEPEASQHGV